MTFDWLVQNNSTNSTVSVLITNLWPSKSILQTRHPFLTLVWATGFATRQVENIGLAGKKVIVLPCNATSSSLNPLRKRINLYTRPHPKKLPLKERKLDVWRQVNHAGGYKGETTCTPTCKIGSQKLGRQKSYQQAQYAKLYSDPFQT